MTRNTSILSRVRRTLGSLILPQEEKSSPFLWPSFQGGVVTWGMGNFLNYVNDGFNLNALVYAAIMYKVRAAAQVRLRGYSGDPDSPEPLPSNHPLSKLLARPNPYQSFAELHGLLIAYLNLAGNAYIYVDRDGAVGGVPRALYPLRPDRVWLIPGSGIVKGYLYRPPTYGSADGVPILPEDLIHIKFPNLADDYEGMGYGLSPMSPLAQSADIDNNATRFIKLFFERGGMPVGILKYNVPLDTRQILEIKQKWRDVYGGVGNWTDVGVVDSDAEYQKLGQDFSKLGMDQMDMRNESRILGPFGVPPILIGSQIGLERSTFSNYGEARTAFWQDTMVYELRLELDSFAHYLGTPKGEFVQWDFSQVPALKQNIGELAASAQKLFSMGVPAHQALATVGLRVPNFNSGDISFLQAGLNPWGAKDPDGTVTAGGQATAISDTRKRSRTPKTQKGSEHEAEADDETHGVSEVKKTKWTEAVDKAATKREDAYKKAARDCFKEDERAVLAIVGAHAKAALRRKSTLDWKVADREIREYLEKESAETWRSTFTPLLSASVEDAGDFWSVELGVAFDLRAVLAEAWFDEYTLEFATPISETTAEGIKGVIQNGMADGQSVPEMQAGLKTLFTGYADYRTERIARTETIRAYNAGSKALYKDWGLEKKEWSAAGDARTRPSHSAANGQTVDIDDHFLVGGYKMDFPGDASNGAPASEFVNCRCSLLPAGDLTLARDMGAAASSDTPLLSADELLAMPIEERMTALQTRYQPRIDALRTDVGDKIAALQRENDELRAKSKALESARIEAFRAMVGLEGEERAKAQKKLDEIIAKQEGYQKESAKIWQQIGALRNGKEAVAAISNGEEAAVKIVSASGGQLKQRATEATGWFKSFLNGEKFDPIAVETKFVVGRSYFEAGTIHVNRSDGTQILVHETTHGIEKSNPRILSATREFLQYRADASGETKPSSLRTLTGDKGYGSDEVAYADNFDSPYTGKFYGKTLGTARATEVLSMGFQQMYEDPYSFSQKDPEFFGFIMSIGEGIW